MQITINTPIDEGDRALLLAMLNGEAPAKPAAKKTVAAPKDTAPAETGDEGDLAAAVAAATKLVSSGQAAKVKEALTSVGAKRVSELSKPEDIATFIAALDG